MNEPCLFKKEYPQGDAVLTVYVDDLIIMTKTILLMQMVKEEIRHMFKVKDLGQVHYILGVQVTRDKKKKIFFLNQEALIQNTLERHVSAKCKITNTPMSPSLHLLPYDGTCEYGEQKIFQAMVGSLLYISRYSRPDISAAVGVISKFAQNPGPEHFDSATKILRYLKGTKSLNLSVKGGEENILTLYCDADWGGDRQDRKLISGYALYLRKSLVSWEAKSNHRYHSQLWKQNLLLLAKE